MTRPGARTDIWGISEDGGLAIRQVFVGTSGRSEPVPGGSFRGSVQMAYGMRRTWTPGPGLAVPVPGTDSGMGTFWRETVAPLVQQLRDTFWEIRRELEVERAELQAGRVDRAVHDLLAADIARSALNVARSVAPESRPRADGETEEAIVTQPGQQPPETERQRAQRQRLLEDTRRTREELGRRRDTARRKSRIRLFAERVVGR